MTRPISDRLTSQQPVAGSDRRLVLLHFNDVYNIEPSTREPVGGASRLAYRVGPQAAKHVTLAWLLGHAYEGTHTHQFERNGEREGVV